jgi:hypothetical protein
MMRRSIGLSLALGLALVGARTASATDYWDLATINDNGAGTNNELVHGTSQQHDLQANPGPVADQDWYVVISYPRSSYEALIDSPSGNLQMYNVTNFQRLDGTGSTVLQTSEFANVGGGAGYSTALRWQDDGMTNAYQLLRAQSAAPFGCSFACGAADQYHIRFYETTVSVPRFNNASGQITVLIIQNSTGWTRPIAGTVYFWNAAGTLVGSTTFSLAAHAALVLNTGTVPGVAGVSGTITVAHDGGYGNLAVKSVALEPATGFSFDSPGLYKPQ